MADTRTDRTDYRLLARLVALLAVALTLVATVILSTVIGPAAAAIGSFLIVGPGVHLVVGKAMQRRPERWGAFADFIIVAGLAYPLILWIGGTVYIALTRSFALAAVAAVAPLVLLVLAGVVWSPDRGLKRMARRSRQAFAAEHGWRYVADGTEALRDHWASADGERPEVTASAVVAGELDGWPVTICDTVDRRGRSDANLTVTWLVHLPVSLPRTVAVPYDSREFAGRAQARPWEPMPVRGYPLSVDDLHLTGDDPAFGSRLATPAVRKATIDGDIVFWRIIGRDLSLARRAAAAKPFDETLRIAARLVSVARALPAEVLAAYGTPPCEPLPFREPSTGDATGSRPGTQPS